MFPNHIQYANRSVGDGVETVGDSTPDRLVTSVSD